MLIPESHWKETLPLYPWVGTLNRIFLSSEVPALNGPTLCLASDYGGNHKASLYETICILAFDVRASADFEYTRREVRSRFLRDKRRMSYKDLNDLRRQEALTHFLGAADRISGICVSFLVSKRILHLCSWPQTYREIENAAILRANWHPRSLETAIRVAHFCALLIAGLSHPTQNVYWISDEDSLFANPLYCSDMVGLVSRFTSYYVKNPLGELGTLTTQSDEGDLRLEDFVAIPDLVAGATAELGTRIAQSHNGHIPMKLAISIPSALSHKSKTIVDWLAYDDRLKKSLIYFDLYSNRDLGVSRLLMQ